MLTLHHELTNCAFYWFQSRIAFSNNHKRVCILLQILTMQPATSALLTAEQVLISASKTQMTFQEIQGRESTKLERYRVRKCDR